MESFCRRKVFADGLQTLYFTLDSKDFPIKKIYFTLEPVYPDEAV